ncbi:hydroxyisourate hydrolase [Sneathiella chinensis]|uniref:5-hydroxyisourate hydrolase n=1 Tax=Sneathiella chinensis TaxID=349750 RepID=A0ABQ5U1V2_9PROT|nr:hydroxyisourate hydrolase [Sneathiella chinensis]GLQ06152.1 5-hydroxyisourate hydrolase [Sneathiella chinensis]
MGKLTTHILDTSAGLPGKGIRIELYRLIDDSWELIKTTTSNDDGRCSSPLLEGDAFQAGQYELVFYAGDYFDGQGLDLPEPKFLDEVVLRFGIADPDQHYHVPLLVSPYSYSTYRGS